MSSLDIRTTFTSVNLSCSNSSTDSSFPLNSRFGQNISRKHNLVCNCKQSKHDSYICFNSFGLTGLRQISERTKMIKHYASSFIMNMNTPSWLIHDSKFYCYLLGKGSSQNLVQKLLYKALKGKNCFRLPDIVYNSLPCKKFSHVMDLFKWRKMKCPPGAAFWIYSIRMAPSVLSGRLGQVRRI